MKDIWFESKICFIFHRLWNRLESQIALASRKIPSAVSNSGKELELSSA